MTGAAAVGDVNWLEPNDLYLANGKECEIERPVFQGDVFQGLRIASTPKKPSGDDQVNVQVKATDVMVVPHPCQCYHGDSSRPFLTVAPVREVENYDRFGEQRTGEKDKFALPDLALSRGDGDWSYQTSVTDFGRLQSLPRAYFSTAQRVACLSHKGLGLLAKRVLGFQLRMPITLANAMAFTAGEWSESFLMQAWVQHNDSLSGFATWLRSEQDIPGLGNGGKVIPYDYRAGALDSLLAAITGEEIKEPEN